MGTPQKSFQWPPDATHDGHGVKISRRTRICDWLVGLAIVFGLIGSCALLIYSSEQGHAYDRTEGCRKRLAALQDVPDGYLLKANPCDIQVIAEAGWTIVANIRGRLYIIKGHTSRPSAETLIRIDHETNLPKHW